ncbi:MAG TPA: APC family permease [Candidatus Avelusimicrobium excrementipullorum]|nr:APC family permease [Candidatus Avelusimicrobium excrementipullorum]
MTPAPDQPDSKSPLRVKKVIVLTTAMLTFIPFWKAAAIVLCDFGSSAFYAGGIAMRAFGPAFPWFILAVMLFAGVLLAVYVESCSLFVRGGVYKVVRDGLGDNAAKFAASAMAFDFLLTGPISSVTAGHYLSGLINSFLVQFGAGFEIPEKGFSVVFALLVTAYFWRQNVKGIEESSGKSAKIISFSLAVCFLLAIWSFITIGLRGVQWPPLALQFSPESLGWLEGLDWHKAIGALGMMIAFGHSVLALSGLETLSQVYREIEYPKPQNLKKAAWLIFAFALLFTGGLTFLSALVIPQELIAGKYNENLLSGLAMSLAGPNFLKLIMQMMVVVAGVVMLSGAVNTALIGANALLNRVAEDGILTDWFRKIHRKYGTTYHIINIVAACQAAVILVSRGDVYLLGEAYAFGVMWCFVLETGSIIMLRFKRAGEKRDFMFPFNIKYENYYIPVGMTLVFLFLLAVGTVNLLTKQISTVSGICFTAFLFTVFKISERLNAKKANTMFEEGYRERMNVASAEDLRDIVKEIEKPNRILVAVKDPDNLYHLEDVLSSVNAEDTEVIVLYAKPVENVLLRQDMRSNAADENELFTQVIFLAEKYGLPVVPVMVQSNDAFYAMAQVAAAVDAKEIVMGVSGRHGSNAQMERVVMAFSALKEAELAHPVTARIVWEGREVSYRFNK